MLHQVNGSVFFDEEAGWQIVRVEIAEPKRLQRLYEVVQHKLGHSPAIREPGYEHGVAKGRCFVHVKVDFVPQAPDSSIRIDFDIAELLFDRCSVSETIFPIFPELSL